MEVGEQVEDLWHCCELGNDEYIFKTSISHLKDFEYDDGERRMVEHWNNDTYRWDVIPLKTDLIVKYILEVEPKINENDLIIIHWWW